MSHLYRILVSCGLVIVFLIFQQTAPALAQMSDQGFFKLGIENITVGNLQQAIVNFTQAIKLNSNLAAAYSNRCLVYLELREYQQATTDCTQALQLNPVNVESYLNRGLAYYKQGHYQQAIADYQQAIKLNPLDYRAYYNRGLVYSQQQDYQQALSDYNQALHHLQNDPQAIASVYNDRGLAYFQLANLKRAISDYDHAIALHESDAAYYNRACARHRQKDYAGAIRDFSQSLNLNPQQAEAYVNRGIARYQMGYHQAAIADLRQGAQCFCNHGEMVASQQTLNLLKKLQQSLVNLDNEVA